MKWVPGILFYGILGPVSISYNVKPRNRGIGSWNYRIALQFSRHIGSITVALPVTFQSDRAILNTNLVATILCDILPKDVLSDIEIGP